MMKYMKLLGPALSLLLAVLLLAGCGLPPSSGASPEATPKPEVVPEATAQPEPAGPNDAVVVTDVDGLLRALADNVTIEIDSAHLRLDEASDYGFGYSNGPYSWESLGDGQYELCLRGLSGLTIRGRGMGQTRITTRDVYADVLSFDGCADLTLEGLTLGHRGVVGGCSGDVLGFRGCDNARIRSCELFGCGVIAVNAWSCSKMRVDDCLLRDCSMAALNVTECLDFQARGCEIANCGSDSPLAVLCVASCEGFALINSLIRDGRNTFLLDAMNSTSVCLLGCEAKGNRFSNALFGLYDYNITVSGCALSDNEFGACYLGGAQAAENGAGEELLTFGDFARMERKDFEGEYAGPAPRPAPTPRPVAVPAGIPEPGETRELSVTNVDELLAAIAPRTTIRLDGEEFRLSSASGYGREDGLYYEWAEEYDGYTLVLKDLEDFALVGGGRAFTLLSTEPRYADVLRFENCRNVSLSDLTMGHTPESGLCTGDVLNINWCEGVTLERCGLFGCGEIGIDASCCSAIRVNETNIYDCSYLGAQLDRVSDMVFSGCSVSGCGEAWGFNGIRLFGCRGVFYGEQRLYDGDFTVDPES